MHACRVCWLQTPSTHPPLQPIPRCNQSPWQTAKDTASSLFAGSVLLGTAGAPEAGPGGTSGAASNGAAGAAAEGGLGLEERRRSSLEASTSLGVFELIEGSAAEAAGSSPAWTRARPPPLTLAELNTFFDAEGERAPPDVPCHAMLCHAVPCHAICWCAMPCCARAAPCRAKGHAGMCHTTGVAHSCMSCHAMPCHAMCACVAECRTCRATM